MTLYKTVRRLLVGAMLTAAVGGALASTPADAATPTGWAYVWANNPTTASYTPSSMYQFNTTGALNTVTRSAIGTYTVRMPNLAVNAGTVHVTAYGSSRSTCKVTNWGPSGTTQLVRVRCFAPNGALADSRFTTSFSNRATSAKPLAYLWANNPTAASYTPSPAYQFNSSGGTNTIDRSGPGDYTAKLPNLAASAGHVQVTAYGSGSERCKVASWGPYRTAQFVRVRCFAANGSPVDTRFTMTYARNTAFIGSGSEPYSVAAYALADQPTAASYSPSTQYSFNDQCAGCNSIIRTGVGIYKVSFPNQPLDQGHVQVTAYGSGSEWCKVVGWTPSEGVVVKCFTATGSPVDTRYDITFVASYPIG